jgi:hypothetical protein
MSASSSDLELQAFELDIKLDGHGWALFTVKVGDQSVTIDGSDVWNCFDELLGAAINIEIGSYQIQTVSFELEPGEQRITLTPHFHTPSHTKFLHITVSESRSSPMFGKTDDPGIQQLSGFIPREAFPAGVQKSLASFASDIESFESNWGNPFPIKGFNALQAAISTQASPEVKIDPSDVTASIKTVGTEKPND